MMKALKLSGLFTFCCELNPSFKCPLRVLCLSISILAYYVPLHSLNFYLLLLFKPQSMIYFFLLLQKLPFLPVSLPHPKPFSQHSFSPKALIASCSSLKPPWISCLIKCPSQELCSHLEAVALSDIDWSIFPAFSLFFASSKGIAWSKICLLYLLPVQILIPSCPSVLCLLLPLCFSLRDSVK